MTSTQMRDAIAKLVNDALNDMRQDIGVNDADQAVPAPSTWAQSQADKNLTRAIGAADEIEMLHHKVLHLEVENKELTRRNDRQCATINELHEKLAGGEFLTINELHEKLAGGEELADKKARRKSLLQSVLLTQALMSDIFDKHDALTGNKPFPEEVLESINTELDLIFQRIHNLGEYVTRNL